MVLLSRIAPARNACRARQVSVSLLLRPDHCTGLGKSNFRFGGFVENRRNKGRKFWSTPLGVGRFRLFSTIDRQGVHTLACEARWLGRHRDNRLNVHRFTAAWDEDSVKERTTRAVSPGGLDPVTGSPPEDLIIWACARDWHRKVQRLLMEHLTVAVKRRLRRMDPDSFYEDDLGWLEQLRIGGGRLDLEPLDQVLGDKLNGWKVRTFHLCRPRDVLSYLYIGIRCLRSDEAAQHSPQASCSTRAPFRPSQR